jgi:predicted nucleic acid-binding protein
VVGIDTNMLVRWLMRDDDRLAPQADALIGSAQPAGILLDRLVLAELAYVLKSNYRLAKHEVVVNLEALCGHESFYIVDSTMVREMLGHFRDNKPLSLEDSWLLTLRRNERISSLLTFDVALRKRAEQPGA